MNTSATNDRFAETTHISEDLVASPAHQFGTSAWADPLGNARRRVRVDSQAGAPVPGSSGRRRTLALTGRWRDRGVIGRAVVGSVARC